MAKTVRLSFALLTKVQFELLLLREHYSGHSAFYTCLFLLQSGAVAVDIRDSMTIIHTRDALVAELAYAVG